MWTSRNSLALSKLCVMVFMGALVGVVVAAPWLVGWLMGISVNAAVAPRWCFLTTIYAGCLPAALLLYDLFRLLHNLDLDKIFVSENVKKLRRISWYCFMGGIIGAVSAFYYLPWAFVGIAACFVGLIVRVVKNIVAQAIELKEENDFTI